MKETVKLIVVGAGEGFYKTVASALTSTAPNFNMRVGAVIDVLPLDALHLKAQQFITEQGIPLFHPRELDHLPISENAAGAIMTPNAHHLWYTDFFTKHGVPVYVEKPVVVSISELRKFLKLAEAHPRLIYAAEYCNDGKALGLLNAAGILRQDDPRRAYLNAQPEICDVYSQLGPLRRIYGKMLEGEGARSSVDHRLWLLDGNQGGMVRDLLSHLFGSLYDLALADSKVISLHVRLGKYEHWMRLGEYRPIARVSEGETYARIEGTFIASYGLPTFKFEVGKYWPKNERFLQLDFEHGRATLGYEKPFELVVETNSLKTTSTVTATNYATLSFLNFKEFLNGKTHGHIGRAAAIVEFNELVRKTGLEQDGVSIG